MPGRHALDHRVTLKFIGGPQDGREEQYEVVAGDLPKDVIQFPIFDAVYRQEESLDPTDKVVSHCTYHLKAMVGDPAFIFVYEYAS